MADKPSTPNPLSNWPLFAMVIAVATLLVSHPQLPIQGTRPIAAARSPETVEVEQDVDARLWEDPLGAMWRDIELHEKPKAIRALSPCVAAETGDHHACRPEGVTQVIGVLIPGAPYAEDEESRRQLRYAVVSGLIENGYVPYDSERIGFFHYCPRTECRADNHLDIPFEVYLRDSAHIVLLWINEDQLLQVSHRCVIPALSQLANNFVVKPGVPVPMTVLGPWASSTLDTMINKPCSDPNLRKLTQFGLRLFNFSATADENVQQAGAMYSLCPIRSVVKIPKGNRPACGVTYMRTVANDSNISSLIKLELENRWGTDLPNKKVALLWEADSFYGQNFERSVSNILGSTATSPHPNLLTFQYLRGLDGKLPPAMNKNADIQNRDSPAPVNDRPESIENEAKQRDEISKAIEQPVGNGQYDYIRRLSNQLRANGEIDAIGVVGSDVYDKLAILQVLRADFPRTLFFTSDLDARIFHPTQLEWTRGLYVASSYGLAARSNLQKQVPPFRSTYQTSAYLATQLALGAPQNWPQCSAKTDEKCVRLDWAQQPALFVIGSAPPYAFQLRLPDARDRAKYAGGAVGFMFKSVFHRFISVAYAAAADKRDGPECARELLNCASVSPSIQLLYPKNPLTKGYLRIGALLVFATAATISFSALWPFVRIPDSRPPEPGRIKWLIFQSTASAICAIIAASVYVYWDEFARGMTLDGTGEPFMLSSGISVWPMLLTRTVAFFVSLEFIAIALASSSKLPKRQWRIAVLEVPLLMFVVGCVLVIPQIRVQLEPPTRDSSLAFLNAALSVSCSLIAAAIALLIIDGTLRCLYPDHQSTDARNLAHQSSTSKLENLNADSKFLNLHSVFLVDWKIMQSFAEHTNCIGRQATYALLIVMLIAVMESGFISGDAIDWIRIGIAAAALGAVLVCIATLWWRGIHLRKVATQRTSDRIIQFRGPGGSDRDRLTADQLDLLIRRISDFQEGAFKPVQMQPVMLWLLVASGAFGGTALLNYPAAAIP